jgi:hypothetical protein
MEDDGKSLMMKKEKKKKIIKYPIIKFIKYLGVVDVVIISMQQEPSLDAIVK